MPSQHMLSPAADFSLLDAERLRRTEKQDAAHPAGKLSARDITDFESAFEGKFGDKGEDCALDTAQPSAQEKSCSVSPDAARAPLHTTVSSASHAASRTAAHIESSPTEHRSNVMSSPRHEAAYHEERAQEAEKQDAEKHNEEACPLTENPFAHLLASGLSAHSAPPAPTAPLPNAADARLAETLANRILVAETPAGGSEVRIQLNASVLADTEILLTHSPDGGLSVKLLCGDPATVQTLVAARTSLQQRLEATENSSVRVDIVSCAQAEPQLGAKTPTPPQAEHAAAQGVLTHV